MNMRPYAIASPELGIKEDIPSIRLSEAWLSESEDIIFQDGELHRAKKRLKEFSQILPDAVLKLYNYKKPSIGSKWLMIITKRDICYRDKNNNRFGFLNPLYKEGTIISAVEYTASFQLEFSLPTGEDLTSEIAAGDYIQIDDNTSYHTGVTWYQVESVDDATHLTCTGQLPSGFSIPTGGQDYTIRLAFGGTDTDHWSCETFHEKFLATNNGVDYTIIWQGSGQVATLSCLVNGLLIKCKRLGVYEDRVLFGWTIENSIEYPFRIRYTGLGDETDLGDSTGSDASYMTANEGEGTFQAFSYDFGFLTIWKEKAIIRAWNVIGIDVFNKTLVNDGIGTPAPDSLVTTSKGTYFFANDNTISHYDGSNIPRVISDNIKKILNAVNPEYTYAVQAALIEETQQLAWAIPYFSSTTNNKVVVYNLNKPNDNWGVMALDVCCWGEYTLEQTYTWNTLPYATWNTWPWDKWNTRAGLSGNPIELIGGYDGYIYRMYGDELDDGSVYTGYGVLETDLGQKAILEEYKRLLLVHAYVRPESTGTMEFEIKRDNEPNWQDVGSITLQGDQAILIKNLPVDYRAKTFQIQPKGANRWRLLGLMLWYIPAGRR